MQQRVESKPIPYQPLPLIFVTAVFGILLDHLVNLPRFAWITLFFVTFAAWFAAFSKKRYKISTVLLLTSCFSLFGFWHHERWNCFTENDLGFFAQEIGEPAALQGSVCEMPRYFPKPPSEPGKIFTSSERTLFTLRVKRLRDGADWISVNGNVSVVVEGDCRNLRFGDMIQLFGSLAKPVGPQNPGDYDYAGMLRSHRILCIIRVSSKESISVLKTGGPGVLRFLEAIRRNGQENFLRNMSPEIALLAAAMILGIREGVDEETSQNLIETGTMHILSISGLHVALAAGIVAFFLKLFGVPRRLGAILLFVAMLTYLFLTDVRPPAIRATVLICVVSAAVFSGRRSFGVNTLCATAIVVLALNPMELFQFGAQLSFLATGAFFWVPRIGMLRQFIYGENIEINDSKLSDIERVETKRWFVVEIAQRSFIAGVGLFLVSVVIWLISIPLILDRFHLFTPVAILVNPLLWFPITGAMIGGFGTMILGNVPLIGNALGWFADISFWSLFEMIAFFQRLGGHYWVPGPPVWWITGFYVVFVTLTFLPIRKPPFWVLVTLLFIWTTIGFCSGYIRDINRFRNDRLTLSVFSIGHGNCILVTTPQKKTFVCDDGCISSPKRAADVMSRAIWRLGKMKIDAIIISHPDSDHYNGVEILADRFYIGAVFVSPYMFEPIKKLEQELNERNITLDELSEDEFKEQRLLVALRKKLEAKQIPLIEIGDGDMLAEQGLPNSMILHPPKQDFGESGNSNATSLVLRFEHRGIGVLLPGDLDGRLRSPFLERKPISCEIVMVPHHGGHSNQTEPLLAWTTPKLLLFSAGRFTHKNAVLEDYRIRGFVVRSTFEEGAIEINIDGSAEK